MKKMYLAWAKHWPAHTYETLGISIHIHHCDIEVFAEKRFNEIKGKNPHPSDGFGKPKIIEISEKLFHEFMHQERYIPIEEYEKLVADGEIIHNDVVKQKYKNKLRIEHCAD